jgi:UDP-N-acetylglucosamine:LPS N-acetylglucosamine transferase
VQTDLTVPAGPPPRSPLVVAVEMGHGHLRAAHALARELGVPTLRGDQPPLAGPLETGLWRLARALYDGASRTARSPGVGRLTGPALATLTAIPNGPPRVDPTAPDTATHLQQWLLDRGLGQGLVEHWRDTGAPLLTPYFATAQAAHRARRRGRSLAPPIFCVVTDVDLARAWVPADAGASRIHYLVPAGPAVQRLLAYGVPESHVHRTGFPLPGELLGGPHRPVLRRDLAARLGRLDPAATPSGAPRPPLVTFVVGGAGAQGELAEEIIDDLAPALHGGRLRLTLAAGTRPGLAHRFTRRILTHRLRPVSRAPGAPGEAEVLTATDLGTYFDRFHGRLAETDLLWTKPSELTFFAALGLPLVLTQPLGVQEERNRAWLLRHGAALDAPVLPGEHRAGLLEQWIHDRLRSGDLARAARNGHDRLPSDGLYRIRDLVGSSPETG